jgi:hypothetical protein
VTDKEQSNGRSDRLSHSRDGFDSRSTGDGQSEFLFP